MPIENSNTSDRDTEPFVEVDPTGRFGRYDDLLGHGAVKKVYRAFDQEEGTEVAWNQVRLRIFSEDPTLINRLYSEVKLLSTLKNKYIIVCYSVWKDEAHNTLNFITEVCTSGNLRQYRKKHRHVSIRALKKWSRQVLEGLEYLHTHEPCIIHRDLNCSNIFINGNTGQVIITHKLYQLVSPDFCEHKLGRSIFRQYEFYNLFGLMKLLCYSQIGGNIYS